MRALVCVALLFASLLLFAGDLKPAQIDPATVTGAALYLDNLIVENLSKLQIVASTPEAAEGDWTGIKRYLMTIPNRLPGVWFYVLPDGSYYSLDADLTGLNLKDRGYFKSLFEGKPVLGYPVYSRSSGKHSAVLAAPIWKDGSVNGALGISVWLDDLHRRVNADLALPEDLTWFAVNREGLTMLDMEVEYIFMNALTQSPVSLKDALTEALKHEQGEIVYELGELKRSGRYQKLPNLDWWLVMARKGPGEAASTPLLELSLQSFVTELQSSLDKLSALAVKHMKVPQESWSSETAIRQVMSSILADSPLVVDVAWVDALGTMRYIEPPEYRGSEGIEIIKQPHVRVTLVEGKAVFSQSFISAEGFPAVVMAFPVKSARGEILGAVSMLLRPELIVGRILAKTLIPAGAELWLMDTGGRILWDADAAEIGLMLFDDPVYRQYESLLKLGRQIAANPSGKGEYVFEAQGSSEKIVKAASWDSVELFGTPWRVVLARRQR